MLVVKFYVRFFNVKNSKNPIKISNEVECSFKDVFIAKGKLGQIEIQ